MTYGENAYDLLPTYVRAADDGTTEAVVTAVASPVEWVVDWLSAGADQIDPELCPTDRLSWVAAIGGIDIEGVPTGETRAFIADPIVLYRGNLTALRKRVGLTLTGAKSVEITTNYLSDANRIAVTTFASQTPDATKTTAAIKAEIPAWLRVTITTNAAGQSYANMASDYATYGAITAGKTYGELALET